MDDLNKTIRQKSVSESELQTPPNKSHKYGQSSRTLRPRKILSGEESEKSTKEKLPAKPSKGNPNIIDLNQEVLNLVGSSSDEEYQDFELPNIGLWQQVLAEKTKTAESMADEEAQARMEDQMAQMALMVQQLAAASLQNTENTRRMIASREANENVGVTNLCKNTIIQFKRENVTNFLNSVEAACQAYEGQVERIVAVLKYAKLRIEGDPLIEATDFGTFEDFKVMITKRFLQSDSYMQLHSKLTHSPQAAGEKTKMYADRLELTQRDYVRALKSHYISINQELTVSRVQEAENTTTKAFMIGLRDEIRKYIIGGTPATFAEAVQMALEGEQANELKKASMTTPIADTTEKKPGPYQSYRGNYRQIFQQRGASNQRFTRGYNRGYQGGNTSYNRGGGYGQGQNGPAPSGNQQQDEKRSGVEQVAPTQNTNNNANYRPRGNGAQYSNRGGCYTCGDTRHRAADCRKGYAAQVASMEHTQDESYYDSAGYDHNEQPRENWRSSEEDSKNDVWPLPDSVCSAATIQIGKGHYFQ